MQPMAPADELAIIRSQISKLRNREQDLRRLLIEAPPAARFGRWAHVEVVTRKMRMFDHRLLPEGVRGDTCFWRERPVTEVRCLPVQARAPAKWSPPPGPDRPPVDAVAKSGAAPRSRPVYM